MRHTAGINYRKLVEVLTLAFTLRPLRLPEDYQPLAELLNGHWSEPTSAEQLEEDDKKLYETGHTWKDDNGLLGGYGRTRRVAVTEDGEMAGYVWTWRAPWTDTPLRGNYRIVASMEKVAESLLLR